MTSRWLITDWLILLLATLLATAPVLADRLHHPRMLIAQRGHVDNGGISLDEAVAKARRHKKDKVLSAETIRVDGRKVYRIKILTKNGRVKRTRIDARTGKKL
ncbi:MAG: PepSY domain-containing protein [Gammaproteobacteria bacterium]|nr:PepSY domain-containing protein [Gammaproteobacteria bacterium]